jgi:hypothetical protein
MKEVNENQNQLKNTNTNTQGLRVNTNYLTAPKKIKYNMDQSNLPKGLRSLDDYQKVYDRDINPIINSSIIELKREKTFINRFQDRHPHLKDLSTTEHIKGKYSLIETIYLGIQKDLLFQKHLMNEKDKLSTTKEDELKRKPIPFYSILQKTLTLYMKRVLILDRLLTTLHQFGINTAELRVAKVLLHQNLEEKQFYLKSFFNLNSSDEEIRNNLTFINKKVTNKYTDYKTSLKTIYLSLLFKIRPENHKDIRELEATLNRYSSKKNSHDLDYFVYFYKEFSLNKNFINITCFTPAQRAQVQGYFDEIYILIQLILMNALIENTHLLVSVSKMEFIPTTKIINQSLEEFLAGGTCSNTVFANLLKAFSKQTIHLVNYFYANCTDHINLYLYPLITDSINPITIPLKQESITSEVKILVGETVDGELILEDDDTPKV